MGVEQALAEKELGNEAYKNKDFVAAHKHYDRAIELDPSNITFLTNKSVFFEEEKYDDCIKICEKAVELGRESRADYKIIAKAFSRMGNAYLKQERFQEALQYFDKSLSEFRDPIIVRKRQEVDKKMKEMERLAYLDPELAQKEREQGNECFRTGKYPEAIRHYTEAVKRNPDDAKLYSNRAACYTKLMEFRLAVSDCDHCIGLDPKFVKGYIRKGAALMALKEMSRASKAYEQALDIDPNNAEALEGVRAASMATSGNPEEIKKRAMEDPAVREILADPAMRMILEQMQSDPGALKEHLQNPQIAAKISKLLEAGIIGIR